MPLPTDWRTDPIVQIEDRLIPTLSGAGQILCAAACGQDTTARVAAWEPVARQLAKNFANGAQDQIGPAGFSIPADERAVCEDASRHILALIPRVVAGTDPAATLEILTNDVQPACLRALDSIRSTFIGGVLRRQAQHAQTTEIAMAELTDVSKNILFISLNASIEAARVGEPGRGFSVIAQEIRSLAQSAQSTINGLEQAS